MGQKTKGKFKGKEERSYRDDKKRASKGGKYGKPDDRGDRADKSCNDFSYDQCHSNDISWWNKAKPVYDNVTKIPFNRIYGDAFTTATTLPTLKANGRAYPEAVPAVLVTDFVPTIGTCNTHSDAVNLAFDALYARIYREYTGAANFTKSELAFHILHAQGIALYIAEAKRILRSLNSFALQNHNFPRAIYAACCGTDVSIGTNYFSQDVEALPAYRSMLNQLIYNFNSLYIPNFTDVFNRWYSLCSNVWMDEDSIEASAYIFRCAGYYKYVEAHDDGTGTLVPPELQWNWDIPTNTATSPRLETIIGTANTLLGEIRNSANFGIVNAAIAKVYGDQHLTIDYFQESETLEPVFDRNMMYQLNNMDIYGQLSNLNVTEDVVSNCLVYTPTVSSDVRPYIANRNTNLLNSYDYNINDEFIMESTRLKPVFRWGNPNDQVIPDYTLDVATEIPCRMRIYYPSWRFNSNTGYPGTLVVGVTTEILYNVFNYTKDNATQATVSMGWDSLVYFLSLLSRFRNHPFIYFTRYGYNGSDTATTLNQSTFAGTIGDLTKYTTVTDEGIQGLNTAALLSVYYIG